MGRVAALFLLTLTSGCSFLKPVASENHYYLLTAARHIEKTANASENSSSCVVRILPVELAGYLQTRDIVISRGASEVDFAQSHRWAERLDSGVRRALAEDLRASPKIRAVITDQPAPAGAPVYNLSVRVLACGGNRTNGQGTADFQAVWDITRSGSPETTIVHGVFRSKPASWQSGNYENLAAQLSQALGNLSQVLLNAIPPSTSNFGS